MFFLKCDSSCVVTPPVTIKCPIWGSPVTRYSFTWDPTEKWRAGKDKVDPITSPTFRFGAKDELEACLVILPHGKPQRTTQSAYYSSVFLQITSRYSPLIRGNLKLNVSTSGTCNEMIISKDTLTPGLGWGFHNMVQRNYIYLNSPERTKLGCILSIVEHVDATADARAAASDAGGQKLELKVWNGLKKLCMSDLYSDVTIVVGESCLQAHKNILATQSTVFEKMFSSDMEEAKSNVINIVDVDVDVVKEMLRYLYTGRVDDLPGTSEELLIAADKYDLSELKSMCEDALCKTLTVDNVSRVLRLSDLHRAQQLKVKSADFMRKNLKEVRQTEGWKSLKETSPELLVEVLNENDDWELKYIKA